MIQPAPEKAVTAQAPTAKKGRERVVLQKLLPFLSLTVLFVALAIASPHFLTSTNLSSVVRQTAVINIMALGMTMIIIAGGIGLAPIIPVGPQTKASSTPAAGTSASSPWRRILPPGSACRTCCG